MITCREQLTMPCFFSSTQSYLFYELMTNIANKLPTVRFRWGELYRIIKWGSPSRRKEQVSRTGKVEYLRADAISLIGCILCQKRRHPSTYGPKTRMNENNRLTPTTHINDSHRRLTPTTPEDTRR
ncbi:uncharacterized protein YALI1_E27622g [Yarrowia lipolytica]|uniref:Uncharacterized protein n=1 Tax=Yarrowia lipolytica TaxID=4952 RepID=A0A1D8NJP2_YARLL|nr:hypothetical protein YALI1_E27622g [Yarrowia lipolytica]